MESTVKAKPSRVVPTSSSGNNILASVFGRGQCEAWSENERIGSSSTKHGEDENLAEPFIRKESESSESSGSTAGEGSGDSAKLFVKPKGRIYAIDFDKEKKGLKVKPSAVSNTSSSSSRGDGDKSESNCDAKVVDKFVRTNQRQQQSVGRKKKKKRKNAKSVLVKLCQCCPWTVPWSLLVVSAIQVSC